MAYSTFTDLTYVSVFSLGRTNTSFFHSPSKRSSNLVLAYFISSLSAMLLSVQISERETAPTLPAFSVPPIETEVKRKKWLFGTVWSIFPQCAEWQTFREVAYHRLFLVPFYEDLHIISTQRVIIWVASGQTHRMFSMLTSDVMGNTFRNGTLSSLLSPVCGSQVSSRKSVPSFDTYSGSNESVSDDCSLETPLTARNKNGD